MKAFENLYKNCPNAQYKKVLLYAPTYRGDADKAYIPEKLDIKALKENFGSEWVLLVKRHGFVKKEWDIPEDCQDLDRKSTRLNSSHNRESRMPSSA